MLPPTSGAKQSVKSPLFNQSNEALTNLARRPILHCSMSFAGSSASKTCDSFATLRADRRVDYLPA